MTPLSIPVQPGPERRLEEAIVCFLESREAGRDVDLADFLERYRDVGAELRQFLADQGLAHDALRLFLRPGQGEGKPRLEPFRNYHILGFLGQGGVGAVFHARDWALNRDLAVKVLHNHLASHPGLVQRFIAEAQINAQLQHPGIVPVHEVGQLGDGRPYFTMKLIKGRTLATLLAERADASQELPRLVTVFEHIAQAVAYAHSKDVLHRDLKPGNVMLGPYGEVLVMDWGLGKVLGGGDAGASTTPPISSVVQTIRQGGSGGQTQSGSALGTFAYMPPEQALGQADRVDKRSDVFGLGAVLCEILTGLPPYSGASDREVRQKAETAELGPARERLDRCGADLTLVDLAKRCLEEDVAKRPADAAAVAAAIAAFQDGVREELRQAELRRARAEERVSEERKKRDWQFALLTTVFLVLTLAGLVTAVIAFNLQQRRQAASRRVNALLTRAGVLHHEAGTLGPDRLEASLGLHKEARAVVGQAAELARNGGADTESRALVRKWQLQTDDSVRAAQEAFDTAQREAGFVAALDRAALAGGLRLVDQRPDREETIRQYQQAFATHTGDPLGPGNLAARLEAFAPAVRRRVADALDHWGLLDAGRAQRLHELARRADPDGWRQRLRDAWKKGRLASLDDLARDIPAESPMASLLLGEAFIRRGQLSDAIAVLSRAQQRHPDHYWINLELGNALVARSGANLPEAVGYYRAAIARSPNSSVAWNNLGNAFYAMQRYREAEAALDRAVQIQPSNANAQCGRASIAFTIRQDFVLAERLLRQALREVPGHPGARALLGTTLIAQGKKAEGATLTRQAERDAPRDPLVLASRFSGTMMMGHHSHAAALCARLVKVLDDRHNPLSQYFEANGYLLNGDLPEAEKAARQGRKDFDHPFWSGQFTMLLAMVEGLKGRPDQAERHIRAAIERNPETTYYYYMLAQAQMWQGQTRKARVTVRELRQKHRDRLPSQAPVWLQDLLLDKLLPGDEEIEQIEKGEARPGAITQSMQAEVALAMNKPYLAYRLFPAKPGSSSSLEGSLETTLEEWVSRMPSGLWNEPGMLVFSNRFNAARAAARAGTGPGRDLSPAAEADRPGLRLRALGWLEEELKEQERVATSLTRHAAVRRWLHFCRLCPDFALVRDPQALKNLELPERQRWQLFWAGVEALLKKMRTDSLTGK